MTEREGGPARQGGVRPARQPTAVELDHAATRSMISSRSRVCCSTRHPLLRIQVAGHAHASSARICLTWLPASVISCSRSVPRCRSRPYVSSTGSGM